MDPNSIILPAVAMFFITFANVLYLGWLRVTAVNRGDVSIGYYRLYDRGLQPERLQQVGRHVQNHFEVPPLFHVVVILLYVTGSVSPLVVGLAWLYVALRCVHTFVHLGANDVARRLLVWAASGFVLAGLWSALLVALLTRG